MTHIRGVDLHNLQADLRRITSNQKLNAEYLLNTYSVDQWKKRIMGNEVKRLAYNEAVQGLQAFLDVCTILYQNYAHQYDTLYWTIPENIRKYVHPYGCMTASEKKNYVTQRELIEEYYNVLLEHMKALWVQVEQMIPIMNEKIMTIVKTYKVQLHIYKEKMYRNHLGETYTHFDPVKVSYTSLYGTQRKRAPIEQRPVPGSASASAISESEETSTIGEGEEEEGERVNSLLEEIEKLMRETPEPETDSDAESTDSE
jgi:hypothetical protein